MCGNDVFSVLLIGISLGVLLVLWAEIGREDWDMVNVGWTATQISYTLQAMDDPLLDCSPLIGAASSGKLRLVRLLVEGGAQVNGRNQRGETALLAVCKALRGEPAGLETMKLLTYLLKNKADPNAQDRAGRTALMYACMERAGAQVVSTLLVAGADPSMEDHCGASALVYAINAQHQPTLKVLMDACQARGRDIIIISTEMGVNGGAVTRRYLNVPPSPNTSPVSCMSPSDIVLKTGSPNSPEGENIFNFRATGKRGSRSRLPSCELSPLRRCTTSPPPPPRPRLLSEPWLAINSMACLNQAYEDGKRERSSEDEEFHQPKVEERMESEVLRRENSCRGLSSRRDLLPWVSQSLTETSAAQGATRRLVPKRCPTPVASTLRRNTLPTVTVFPPLLHLPPLVNRPDSHLQVPPSKSRSLVFLPHPPSSSPPSSASRLSGKVAVLPPLPPASSLTSLLAPSASSCCSEMSRRPLRRHSVQLEQIGRGREG